MNHYPSLRNIPHSLQTSLTLHALKKQTPMYFGFLNIPLEKKALGTASEPSFCLYITQTTESQCMKGYCEQVQ